MNEAFLYYIWKHRLFGANELSTTGGEPIQIIHPGYRNEDSGPDFFNAKIRIGEVVWAGNVEIHVKSSDWKRHRHSYDDAFDTIILHVVDEHDQEVLRKDRTPMPVLSLKGLYADSLYQHYLNLIQGPSKWVPCEKQYMNVPSIRQHEWYARLLAERLEERSKNITSLLKQTKNNWEESFYRHLARSFGFRVNNLPFELLASSLPLSIISKHRNNLLQMEALFFGQAGFLEGKMHNIYSRELQREFFHLKIKFNLIPLMTHIWKFGRLRPGNFPTLRIAQFAMLYHLEERLFDKLVNAQNFDEVSNILDISPGKFWDTHYSFESKSRNFQKKIGKTSIDSLLINSIAPFMFYYGTYHQLPEYCAKALNWLERCKPEGNQIIRGWEQLGLDVQDAAASQSLIHLKKNYCDYKKCVNCGIGQYILKQP